MSWNSAINYAETPELLAAREKLRKAKKEYETAQAAHNTTIREAEKTARTEWLKAFHRKLLENAPCLKDARSHKGIDRIEATISFCFGEASANDQPQLTIRIHSTKNYINSTWNYWNGEELISRNRIDLNDMTPEAAANMIWQQIKSDTDL